ncbi:uncharacterized protein LOC127710402 [Mytilus californianus]|uniref:uncharacterized protein LOC127710402 n=1 Tax=Mytilus californianus TaxID=6549 RepID=UPI002248058F|nr:uncharacterized protein LOC127710402 [Mytilus californianus]
MTNISEVVGTDGINLKCVYANDHGDLVTGVDFFAINDSTDSFVKIAESTLSMSNPTKLLPYGEYLFGSAYITKLSDLPSEVVLTFNDLKCKHERSYRCRLSVHSAVPTHSAPIQIFVRVPPSKPQHVLIIDTPVDVSTTAAKASVRIPTSSKNKPTITFPGKDIIQTTPLYNFGSQIVDDDILSTTFSDYNTVQQMTEEKSIMGEDYITFKCSGNVGKPAGMFIFQKFREDNIQSTTYNATTTEIEEIPGNCSYYRTSYLIFQVTAEDNLAVIRCVVVSPLAEEDTYVDSEKVEVKYHVQIPTVTKHPDKQEYIIGRDISIILTCTSDGNPKPIYRWYKENQDNGIITAGIFIISNINTTNGGIYICNVSNTINGHTYTKAAKMEVDIINEENEAKSTTSKTIISNQTAELKNDNTAVIVVGTVCGSIILVLCVMLFAVVQNKKKTLRCPLTVNCRNITEDYVNTTQQHNSLYEGVGHVLDVHNYEELSTREHQYTNTNFSYCSS